MAKDARDRGRAAMQRGDWAEALSAFGEVLAEMPRDADALMRCGIIHGQMGDLPKASRFLGAAAAAAPASPDVHINLAKLAIEQRDWRQAEQSARRAVALSPAHAIAHENLVVALKHQGRWEDAETALEAAIARCSAPGGLLGLLGELRQRRGDIAGAMAAFAQAPATPTNISCLLASYNYAEGISPQAVFAAHKTGSARIEASVARLPPPAPPREGRLRVGYLSPDLRDHSVAFFIEPVLAAHDRSAVEVFCYSTAARPDAVTQRLASLADHWRNCASHSDGALAKQVRSDGIDLLIDLAGHTVGNRLPAFAMRPAPVQATWIGYPNTTGLTAMDFRLTDAVSDPPGADAFYTERLVRLPHGFLCYRPPDDAPAPQPPPPERPLTFASFNAVPKYGDACIAAWSAILRRLPAARLRLKAYDLANGLARRRLLARFSEHGIDAGRIELLPLIAERRAHLAVYNEVDLALDTFPYNGTTTTCEALWMGVPVLALRGESHAGRTGASLLTGLGLQALIAATIEDYVEAAVAMADAGHPWRSAERRRDLRTRMQAAPLCRPALFVPSLERAYRDMATARRAELTRSKASS